MKVIVLVAAAGAATVLAGCAAAPQTAWGKPNVSKVDYGTDIGMCTGLAAMQGAGNQSKTAGGVDGAQTSTRPPEASGGPPPADVPGGANTASSPGAIGANLPTGSGMYQNNTSPDVVQRAANQEQARVMAAKRARADAFKSCITQRGYTEFTLTPAQRQKLATLKPGSNEYHEYLYSLGADPSVVNAQSGR